MKNKIIILGLIFSVAFSSCTDWLNPKPLDSLVGDDYWKTKDDVESAVYACYEAMTQKAYMQRIILGGEVRADNVIDGPTNPSDGNNLRDLLEASIQPDNTYAKWQPFYKVINYCNSVIKFAPGVRELDPDYTEGFLNIDLAEAHTLRALTYFYLARLYKDIPYEKVPYSEDTQDFNTEAAPGDSILREELILLATIAEPGAVRTRGNSFNTSSGSMFSVQNKGRITKTSVRTLMADMYLWLGMYEECEAMCNKVLEDVLTKEQYTTSDPNLFIGAELYMQMNENSDGTTASQAYRTIFVDQNSQESIFELQFTSLNLTGGEAAAEILGSAGSTRWFNVPSEIMTTWNVFETSDLRKTDNLQRMGTTDLDPVRPVKYAGTQIGKDAYSYRTASSPRNWIFYRLSDIYLMKAEALVEMGESRFPEAIELINITYTRSNPNKYLDASKYSGLEAMRELVLLERQREFMFEGKRWFDLFRQARKDGTPAHVLPKILRKYKYTSDAVESKLKVLNAFYMPIHKDELISNKNLNQNPEYNKEKPLE